MRSKYLFHGMCCAEFFPWRSGAGSLSRFLFLSHFLYSFHRAEYFGLTNRPLSIVIATFVASQKLFLNATYQNMQNIFKSINNAVLFLRHVTITLTCYINYFVIGRMFRSWSPSKALFLTPTIFYYVALNANYSLVLSLLDKRIKAFSEKKEAFER